VLAEGDGGLLSTVLDVEPVVLGGVGLLDEVSVASEAEVEGEPELAEAGVSVLVELEDEVDDTGVVPMGLAPDVCGALAIPPPQAMVKATNAKARIVALG